MLPVIVAGGLGTRMGGEALPKALLAVAGKPLIDHQLRWLKNAGFSTVALCLGHKAEAIRSYCGAGKRWGLDLRYCVETQPRGTAGCVKDLRLDQDALVVYGDLYPDLELAPLLRGHGDHPEAGATLALLRTDHPRDSDLARLEGWRVCAIYRDPEGLRGGDLALAAVWIVRPSLLDLAPDKRPSDFGRDVFPEALRRGLPLAGCPLVGILADLGTPERFERFRPTETKR